MKKTTIGLLVLPAMLLVALVLSGYAEKAHAEEVSTDPLQSINGLVVSLSLRTVAGPKTLNSPTIDLSKKDPKSTVIMALNGKAKQEYRIPVSEIVNIEGFTDLKGKHEVMGGLLILTDLQKRIVGKSIALKGRKIGKEKDQDIFGVHG